MALTLTGTGANLGESGTLTITATSIASPTVFIPVFTSTNPGDTCVFTPSSVTLTSGILTATLGYVVSNSGGPKTFAVTNNQALTNPTPLVLTITIKQLATKVVADLLRRSLTMIGRYAPGETPESDVYNDALDVLNEMLGQWALEGLMIFSSETLQTTQTSTFTIGPSGDVIAPRPLAILNAYSRIDIYDRPVAIINEEQWADIRVKTQSGYYPNVIWYEPTFPNGTVHVWMQGTSTLFFQIQTPLAIFTAITDQVFLPFGYEQAVVTNLAVMLAPEYGFEASPTIQKRAIGSKAAIKNLNAVSPKIPLWQANQGNILVGWEYQ